MTRAHDVIPRESAEGGRPRNPAASRGPWQIPRCARNDRCTRLALVSLVLVFLGGCRQQVPTESDSVSDTVERGPLNFTVEVTPKQVWIGDPVVIELHVETPDDYLVQLPGEEELGELQVGEVDSPDPRPGVEGGLLWQRTFTIESLVSGVVEVPPLVVKYARKPTQADTEPVFEHQLETDPLEIEVRSALTTRDSVLEPRDITGALLPPKKPLSPWAWATIIGATIIVAASLVLLVVWLQRLARRPAPPIPPEVWALRALGELETARLIDSGRAKEFYYRLSEIVRVYIERQFGLAAPEMTTEEFLGTLARNRGALPCDADRLREFLQACDLVKYAAFSPRAQDAEQALSTARAFVDATAAARQAEQGTAASETEARQGEQAA